MGTKSTFKPVEGSVADRFIDALDGGALGLSRSKRFADLVLDASGAFADMNTPTSSGLIGVPFY
jgi:hypothetical protein